MYRPYIILLLVFLVFNANGQLIEEASAPDSLAKVDTTLVQDSLDLSVDTSIATTIKEEPIGEQVDQIIETINRQVHQPWLFFVFILQLVLLAYLKVLFTRDLQELLRGFFNLNIAQQLHRDQELTMPLSSVILNFNYVLSIGLYVYLLVDFFALRTLGSPFTSFLFFSWVVLMIYAIKYTLLKIASWVFTFTDEANTYNFNFFLVHKLWGLVLIPVNLVMAYAPEPINKWVVFGSFVLFSAVVIVSSIKGLLIGKSYLAHKKFHFFLYICTLEIAPLVIVLKIIMVWLHV